MELKRLKNKKRAFMGTCTGILCAGMLFWGGGGLSAFADGPSTNVWIDVVEVKSEARVSVTVPTSYGFVVVGTTDPTVNNPITVDDGTLLLSNVRVKVTNSSNKLPNTDPGSPVYKLEWEGLGAAVPVRNYSTHVKDADAELDDPPRHGVPITLKPYLIEQADAGKTHWMATDEVITDAEADFKKYQMSIGGLPLSEKRSRTIDGDSYVTFESATGIDMDAPPDVPANGHTAGGTANVPAEMYLGIDVVIGGKQSQYKQVEESAKVSMIYWEIIPGEIPATNP